MRRAALALIAIALTAGGLSVGQSGSSATPDEVVRDSASRLTSS